MQEVVNSLRACTIPFNINFLNTFKRSFLWKFSASSPRILGEHFLCLIVLFLKNSNILSWLKTRHVVNNYFIFFFLKKCYSMCILYVCVPLICLMTTEAPREHQISWICNYKMVTSCWEINPCPLEEQWCS